MKQYKIHPATEYFPEMAGQEFDALVEDIRKNGQQEPACIYNGKLLDGRNRMRACKKLNIELKTKQLNGEVSDPFSFVMSLNYHRRHLKPHEKGKAIKAYLEMRGGKVGENKGGRPGKNKPAHNEQVSVVSIAKELGIPRQTADKQIKAAETYEALPDVVKKSVDAGECPLEIAPQVTETIDRKTQKRIDKARESGLLEEVEKMQSDHIKMTARINATKKWLGLLESACRFHGEFISSQKWSKAEKQIFHRIGDAMIAFGNKLKKL